MLRVRWFAYLLLATLFTATAADAQPALSYQTLATYQALVTSINPDGSVVVHPTNPGVAESRVTTIYPGSGTTLAHLRVGDLVSFEVMSRSDGHQVAVDSSVVQPGYESNNSYSVLRDFLRSGYQGF